MERNQGTSEGKRKRFNPKGPLAMTAYVAAALTLFLGSGYAYLYASTPGNIRHPSFGHYHFRTQIIVDGRPVDFSRQEFQEDTSNTATSCSIALNGTPIDFHNNEDQLTHIHWGGITGGQFLKYYGWNLIGGGDNSLGRRYDQGMMRISQVGIKGKVLPDVPQNSNFYIYIGDEKGYVQKDWNDFLSMDLERFFGKQNRIEEEVSSFNILDLFTQKAYAHGSVDDGHEGAESGPDSAALEKINNLVGNVVIFVQEKEPGNEQIQERFANLVPLRNSTCGG